MSTAAGLRTYFYRVLLPHGKVKSGFLRLLVERDHSVRLRLEQTTEGAVLNLVRLPAWFTAVNDLRLRLFRRHVRQQDLAGFLRAFEHQLAALEEMRNDAGDMAAMGQDRAGDRAHQTIGAAAINQADAGLGHQAAQRFGGLQENRVRAVAGAAEDTDRLNQGFCHAARIARLGQKGKLSAAS